MYDVCLSLSTCLAGMASELCNVNLFAAFWMTADLGSQVPSLFPDTQVSTFNVPPLCPPHSSLAQKVWDNQDQFLFLARLGRGSCS